MPSEPMREYLRLESELRILAPDDFSADEIMDKMDDLWLKLTDDEHAELTARELI